MSTPGFIWSSRILQAAQHGQAGVLQGRELAGEGAEPLLETPPMVKVWPFLPFLPAFFFLPFLPVPATSVILVTK